VLAEFGDDPRRYADGKARRNYAGPAGHPRLGQEEIRHGPVRANDRLIDALNAQAFSALGTSPGARAFYDQQRASGHGHNDALRRLANRLVGILHGCLKHKSESSVNPVRSDPQHVVRRQLPPPLAFLGSHRRYHAELVRSGTVAVPPAAKIPSARPSRARRPFFIVGVC
jgi:hypothetical protein